MDTESARRLIKLLREDAEHPAYKHKPISITWRAAADMLEEAAEEDEQTWQVNSRT